jgi:two-component system, chemotaxis family, chemotaxis protein CheY
MIALVVDDSAAMRRIQQMTLEKYGWQVELAPTGEDALRKLSALERCDLLVTDWHMPGMGGLELVRTIRGETRHDGLRILMVTSEGMLGSIQQAIAAGANDFVMKPFTREALIERVNEVMRRRGAQ